MTSPAFDQLLPVLVNARVQFILVGGLAGVVHGASRLTYDVDLVYARDRMNLEKLAATLAPYHPYLRDAPPNLPFRLDVSTLRQGLNFTLTTSLGDIDLLGEVVGGGNYHTLLPLSQPIDAFGVTFQCVNLPTLIQLKRAAGRPKDLEAIAELETLLEERN